METRVGKIIVSHAGGTAGNGSKTYKIAMPTAWISQMGLSGSQREVILSFDGASVSICPLQSLEQFREARQKQGHDLMTIRYYNGDSLCTEICADRTARDLRIDDHTENPVKSAFGNNRFPSWDDLEEFLEERCIPRQRAGMREYLDALGLEEYDPLAIIQKTKGHMAEDDQWMEVEFI